MTFEEALRILDSQVLMKTGKRLTSVEKVVIEAAWKNEEYENIAGKSNYRANYLRGHIAPKLWKQLSLVIGNGTKVTKKRLRSILEDPIITNNFQLPEQLNNRALESTASTSAIEVTATQGKLPSSAPQLQNIYGQLPDISNFYGREAELHQLEQFVASNRGIVAYGPTGIGKSAMIAKLVTQLVAAQSQPTFDHIVWQSVCYAPPLESLLVDLLQALPPMHSPNRELPSSVAELTGLLIQALQTTRCLVVLDEAEAWLQGDRNKSFDIYGEKYAEYGIFLRRLVEAKHHSCIVLTSQEPFKDMIKLQNSGRPICSLKITGLDLLASSAILRRYGLSDEHKWESLLAPYLGNPSAIERVASRIDRFFGGNVVRFLNHKTALTSEVYKDILLKQFQPGRLTSLEKQILFYLVEKTIDAPIGGSINNTFTQLVSDLQNSSSNALSLSAIMEAIDALDQRSLVVISKEPKTRELLLDLPVLAQDYLTKRLKSLSADRQRGQGKLFNLASQLFDLPHTSENFAL